MAVPRGYLGATAQTRSERRSYACPCGERFVVELHRALDVGKDPDLGRAFLAGELNLACCPACRRSAPVPVSVLWHDPIAERLVLVLSDGLRHLELEERGLLYQRLATDGEAVPDYVRGFGVVFGVPELAAVVHPPEEAVGTRVTARPPVDEHTPPLEVQGRPPRLAAEPERAGAAPREDTDRRPLPAAPERDDTGRTRVRIALPDVRSAAAERWIANREGPAAMLSEDRVLLCAALPAAELERLLDARLEVRIQLHRLPAYPLVFITLVAAVDGGPPLAVHVPLDIARAAHRAVLDQLGRRFEIDVLVHDLGYLPVLHRSLVVPLEENARRIAGLAKDARNRVAPAARSFERALQAFNAPGFDRLGRIHVALSDVELGNPKSLSALRQAIAVVARWSEPAAESYLVEIRSFPLPEWRRVRVGVVRAAVERGLHTPRSLAERVLAEAEVQTDWAAVLRRQLAVFAEVCRARRGHDLAPNEVAENWRLLLAEAKAVGLAVEPSMVDLARRAERSAETPTVDAIDLAKLDAHQLVSLLERRELRREVAIALCERGDPAVLGAAFAALRRMTRAEASRVLPALTVFGAAAERHFIEGLRSRKSYLRQGCALALGTVGGAAAAEALTRQLVEEPTEIWPEVARAIGDLGAGAVGALRGRLHDADADGRERIAWALAHLAAGEARESVEALARDRDGVAARAARRGLELQTAAASSEAEIRGDAPPREATVVRAFSRRFFEALGGDELSEEDLEEVDEAEEDDEAATTVLQTQRNPRLPPEGRL